MIGYVRDILNIFFEYAGGGFMIILYLAALLYILVSEKDPAGKRAFVYYPIVLVAAVYNPISYYLFKKLGDGEIYYRFIWLLPISMTIAYAACRIVYGFNGKKRIAAGIVLTVLACLAGKLVYDNPFYSRAENIYHMPDKVVDICDRVIEPGREVMAAFPPDMVQYVEQYTPMVKMPYGRNAVVDRWNIEDEILDEYLKESFDPESLFRKALVRQCHYVVIPSGFMKDDDYGKYEYTGYSYFDTIDGYILFRNEYFDFYTR